MSRLRIVKAWLRATPIWIILLLFIVLLLMLVIAETLQENTIGFVRNARETDLQNQFVNKHQYKLLLNENNMCKTDDVFLLIAVLSAPRNSAIRQTIRKTYGTVKVYRGTTVKVIFLLGVDTKEDLTKINPDLKQESDKFHDIVLADFIDDYNNLTHKTILGLHWFNNYCRTAKYIMKIDDDVILNIYKLLYFLHEHYKQNGNLSNFLYCKKSILRTPFRSKSSKFYISYEEYPYTFLPEYCDGPGYIFSNNVGFALYEASKKVPFFRLEDIYVSFCAKEADIHITDSNSFFGFLVDTNAQIFYWPIDWVILRHFKRDSKQWYQLWDTHLSYSDQHTISYYQTLQLFFAVVFFSIICVSFVVTMHKRFFNKIYRLIQWPRK